MFSTMSSFLWFFFIMFGLIVLGILFEEKLIVFEEHLKKIVCRIVRAVVRARCAARLVVRVVVATCREYYRRKEFAR